MDAVAHRAGAAVACRAASSAGAVMGMSTTGLGRPLEGGQAFRRLPIQDEPFVPD